MLKRILGVAVVIAAMIASVPAASGPAAASHSAVVSAARQRVTWTNPSAVIVRAPIKVNGRFAPVRRGRPVALQIHRAGAWRTIARDRQDSRGAVSFRTAITVKGSYPVRLVAARRGGLRALVTRARRLLVLPDPARGQIRRLSIGGRVPNAGIFDGQLSSDGRYFVFASHASNLVPGDSSSMDVFRADLVAGTVIRVTSTPTGLEPNGPSYAPDVSDDGRYVVYESEATDIHPRDTDQEIDILLYDAVQRRTSLISRNYVDSSSADGTARYPVISGDGTTVVFRSSATNLVAGPQYRGPNIYAFDLDGANRMDLLSRPAAGGAADGPSYEIAVSTSGDRVAINTEARNLAPGMAGAKATQQVVWIDRVSGKREWVNRPRAVPISKAPTAYVAGISADGRTVAFNANGPGTLPTDRNGVVDAFVWSETSRTIQRVGITRTGAWANGYTYAAGISADGRYVTLHTSATNLVPGARKQGTVAIADLRFRLFSLLSRGSFNGVVGWAWMSGRGARGVLTTPVPALQSTPGLYLFTRTG